VQIAVPRTVTRRQSDKKFDKKSFFFLIIFGSRPLPFRQAPGLGMQLGFILGLGVLAPSESSSLMQPTSVSLPDSGSSFWEKKYIFKNRRQKGEGIFQKNNPSKCR